MDPSLIEATLPYCFPMAEKAAVKSGNLAINGIPPMIGHDFGPGALFPFANEKKFFPKSVKIQQSQYS